jgi:hypothetical protein
MPEPDDDSLNAGVDDERENGHDASGPPTTVYGYKVVEPAVMHARRERSEPAAGDSESTVETQADGDSQPPRPNPWPARFKGALDVAVATGATAARFAVANPRLALAGGLSVVILTAALALRPRSNKSAPTLAIGGAATADNGASSPSQKPGSASASQKPGSGRDHEPSPADSSKPSELASLAAGDSEAPPPLPPGIGSEGPAKASQAPSLESKNDSPLASNSDPAAPPMMAPVSTPAPEGDTARDVRPTTLLASAANDLSPAPASTAGDDSPLPPLSSHQDPSPAPAPAGDAHAPGTAAGDAVKLTGVPTDLDLPLPGAAGNSAGDPKLSTGAKAEGPKPASAVAPGAAGAVTAAAIAATKTTEQAPAKSDPPALPKAPAKADQPGTPSATDANAPKLDLFEPSAPAPAPVSGLTPGGAVPKSGSEPPPLATPAQTSAPSPSAPETKPAASPAPAGPAPGSGGASMPVPIPVPVPVPLPEKSSAPLGTSSAPALTDAAASKSPAPASPIHDASALATSESAREAVPGGLNPASPTSPASTPAHSTGSAMPESAPVTSAPAPAVIAGASAAAAVAPPTAHAVESAADDLGPGWKTLPPLGKITFGRDDESDPVDGPDTPDPREHPSIKDVDLNADPRATAAGPRSTGAAAARVDANPHIVEKNENFWTISRLYYGSGRYYRALWKANSAKYPNIEDLHVNDVIRIPAPEDLDPAFIDPPGTRVAAKKGSRKDDAADLAESATAIPRRTVGRQSAGEIPVRRSSRDDLDLDLPATSTAARKGGLTRAAAIDPDDRDADSDSSVRYAARPSQSRPAVAKGVRYKIRRNDTLRSIARDRLGDSHRADEILELNSDVIDDPNQLVVGQVITLPADARTSSRR